MDVKTYTATKETDCRQAPGKQPVLGIGVSKTNYTEVVELCARWALERKSAASSTAHYICVAAVHGIMLAHSDARMAEIFNEADVVTPDGMPLVWALRSFGLCEQQRVYGPTLMLDICHRAAQTGLRIFLYGGREETLPVLKARLLQRFPGLRIAGSFTPPFRQPAQAEEEHIVRMIRESDADIVFVGIGTPKQERWMHGHRDCFPGVTLIGVGAAFDFHSGRVRQAPGWMQRNGLEWLFRLIMEPRRLWKRYLWVTPRFLPLWAMQRLRTGVCRPHRP